MSSSFLWSTVADKAEADVADVESAMFSLLLSRFRLPLRQTRWKTLPSLKTRSMIKTFLPQMRHSSLRFFVDESLEASTGSDLEEDFLFAADDGDVVDPPPDEDLDLSNPKPSVRLPGTLLRK